jgi:hypothetical protein
MKNAGVKPALQKKSPGQKPGRNFLQEQVYQTHTPLVKGQFQYWYAPAMDPRLTESPVKFRTAALYRIPIHASTSYIYYGY